MTNKVGMISLGCPKNQVDGEVMLEKLNKSGFEIAQNIEDSDVMIINTCGFIEDAKREAIETILEVAEYKKAGIISAIVVTGCLAERYQDEIIKEIPEVDSVIGIGADNDIVKVCHKALLGVRTSFYPDKNGAVPSAENYRREITEISVQQVKDFCKKYGITENVFFISAFGITLGKYNFKKDAVFTTIYHGRNDSRL